MTCPLVLIRLFIPVVTTRAFRTRMKAVNQILRSLELLFKCPIQANRLCGLTIAHLHSTAKKLRNCGSKPRGNPLNHQQRERGNVQSSNLPLLLWTSSARPVTLICMPTITIAFLPIVFSYRLPLHRSRPRYAQPPLRLNHSSQSRTRSFFTYMLPGGHNYMSHCVFRLALLATASSLHIKSLSASRPSCCPYF